MTGRNGDRLRSIWGRVAGMPERELAATLIGLIALAGPLVGLVTMLFPQPPGTDKLGAVIAFAASAAIGATALWQRRRMSWAAIGFVTAIGAAVITVVMLTVPDRTAAYASYYVWLGIFSFYFLRPSWALAQVAWIGVLYGVAVEVESPPAAMEQWINGVATTLGVGLLVLALRGRIGGLVGRLETAALTDELTGLPNRRAFAEQIERELKRARRSGESLALVAADLDGLKTVNDRDGHLEGDLALRTFADAVRHQLRGMDSVARVGGDEFAVLLPGATEEEAVLAAERLRSALARASAGEGLDLRASIGVAASTAEQPLASRALFAEADAALYTAKRAGGDRVASAATRSEA